RVPEHSPERPIGPLAAEEVLLIRCLLVRVAGRDHHPLDAQLHHVVEEGAHPLRIASLEDSGVGRHAEAARKRGTDGLYCRVITAFAAHRELWLGARAITVDAEA